MSLTIRILTYKDRPHPEPGSVVFDQQGGSLGRTRENRLVLSDPEERLVSRKHALITYENGCYYLTDTSKNGTLICNKDLLLQKDTIMLADGDRLEIGDYELLVNIYPERNGKEVREAGSSAIPPDFSIEDLLGGGEEARSSTPEAESGSSLAEEIRPPSPINVYLSGPDVLSHEEQPEPFREESAAIIPEDFNIIDLIGSQEVAKGSDLEAAGGSGLRSERTVRSVGPINHGAPDVSSHPKSPQALRDQGAATIPEDFNIEDLMSSPEATTGPDYVTASESGLRSESPVRHAVPISHGGPDVSSPLEKLKHIERQMRALAPDEATVRTFVEESSKEGDRGKDTPGLQAVGEHLQETSEGPVDVETGVVSPGISSNIPLRKADQGIHQELFGMFLKGAGIEDTSLVKPEDIPYLMHTIGKVLREMIHGIMAILRGRAQSKAQLHLMVTVLGSEHNNPLKFLPTVDDALRHLLARNQRGYMNAYDAVREGFRDIMNHDLAMKAGVQAALVEALKRFDPRESEKLYQEGIVVQRKAKCWNAYSQNYRKIFEDVMENFFGQAFIQAYEEQMSKLCKSEGTCRDLERGISDD